MVFKRVIALLVAVNLTVAPMMASAQQAGGAPAAPAGGAATGGAWTASSAEGPDAITLKDGQVLRGTLQEVHPGEKAVLQLPSGQTATVRWDGIARIDRNGQPVNFQGAPPVAAGPVAPTQATPPPVATAQPAPNEGQRAAQAAAAWSPATIEYHEDEPAPPGYHLKTKPKLGLLITGAVLTAIGLIGVIAIESSDPNPSSSLDRSGRDTAAVVVGLLFMGPGVPLLILGLVSKKKYWQKDTPTAADLEKLWKLPVDVGVGVDPHHGSAGLYVGKRF